MIRRRPVGNGSRGLLFVALLLLFPVLAAFAGEPPELAPDIELFSQRGCPHCEDARRFLLALVEERPEIIFVESIVTEDAEGRARFQQLAELAGVRAAATPSLLVRGHLIVGWGGAEKTGRAIEAILDDEDVPPAAAGSVCKVDFERSAAEGPDCETDSLEQTLDLPLFGEVKPQDLGLPLFTMILGLVDGFNPCAMWVLLFLLSLLVHLKDRARMFLIAGTFVLVSGVVYFAFMAAWFTIFDFLGQARIIQIVLGCLAVFVGFVHAKDFFALHEGLTFSIPDRAKPGIYARVTRILTARSMGAALMAVTVLAVMVNMVELLCTAGLPAVYTNVLAQHELPRWQVYAYIGLYQVFYMLDDAVMVVIAIMTLSNARLQEASGQWLKLLSGVVMIGLGFALILKPEWLYW